MDTLAELLSQINTEKDASGQAADADVLRNLVQQQMTQGLSVMPTSANPMGGPTYSGPVAGYAGALRPSDVPTNTAGADIPVYNGAKLSPQTMQARLDAGGPFRGILKQPQAEQLMQGLQSLSGTEAGVAGPATKGILEALGFGETSTDKMLKGLIARQSMKETTPLGVDKASKLFKYDPASRQFVTPDNMMTDAEAQKAGFKTYTDKQRAAVSDVAFANTAFEQLVINKAAADKTAGESAFGPLANIASDITQGHVGGEAGRDFEKSRTQFTSAFDGLIGGVRGAASPLLTQIRLKVLPTLYTEKGTSNELLRQVGELVDVLSQSKINTMLGVPASQAYNDKELAGRAQAILDSVGIGGKSQARAQFEKANPTAAPAPSPTPVASANSAPQAAVAFLKAHPESKDAFKAKYGYLP